MDKIYLVVEGQYIDWNIVGYFIDKDDAERFCVLKHDTYDEPYVKEVACLDGGVDLSNVEVLYEHEVVFDGNGRNMYMRVEPDRYEVYGGEMRANRVKAMGYHWIAAIVNQREFNREKAEKIAQDILYQYLELSNGKEYDKLALDTINYNLSAPQRAREEEHKAEELRKTELAKLEWLKAKYEG